VRKLKLRSHCLSRLAPTAKALKFPSEAYSKKNNEYKNDCPDGPDNKLTNT
jgi:hypothetical protein